eukprot:NODE_10604_length_1340_cov_6.089860.p2 GENE.NODE_10604_length_1340_cov_6.089860~~NODE_10604_length_1340_cov_6.089860.p2  ORF type:complete len:330 (+),score=121.46 NODE_10604_length_1340_cov_6.089860:139-990(+)
MSLEKGNELLAELNTAFEATPSDLAKCEKVVAQLKLVIFSESPETPEKKALARKALELAALVSVRKKDNAGFERHVAQLKPCYNDQGLMSAASPLQYPVLGLYLLHLLAADRIGEFHTELELIPIDEHENKFIKYPIELERYLMEGNYAKVLSKSKDVPQEDYRCFLERLLETVRLKVGASMERSYTCLPAEEAVKMLILKDLAELQHFAKSENERKDSEESEPVVSDMTPAFSRHRAVGVIRWQVKDGRLHFVRPAEKLAEIPALETMVNTISYATDLERIV